MKKIVPRQRISAYGYNQIVDTSGAALQATESPGDKTINPGWGTANQFTDPNPLRVAKVTGTNELGYSFIEQYDPTGTGVYEDSPFGITGSLDTGISLRVLPGVEIFEDCIVIIRQNPYYAYRYELVSKIACPEPGGSGGSGGSGDTPYTDVCTGTVQSAIRYRYTCTDGVLFQYSWLETLSYDTTGCLVSEIGDYLETAIGCCDCGNGGSGGSGGEGTGGMLGCCEDALGPATFYLTLAGITPTSIPLVWDGTDWVSDAVVLSCGLTRYFRFDIFCGLSFRADPGDMWIPTTISFPDDLICSPYSRTYTVILGGGCGTVDGVVSA